MVSVLSLESTGGALSLSADSEKLDTIATGGSVPAGGTGAM